MMVDVRSAWNGATGVRGSSTSLRAFPTCRAVLLAITTVIESNNGGLRMRFSGRGQQTGGRRLAALAARWLVDGSIPARGRREWACARRSVAGIRLPVSPERGERRESSSSSPSAFACAGQDGGAVGRGLPGFLWRLRLPMSRRADGSRASTLIRGTGTGGRAGALARSRRCVAAGLLLAFTTLLALPLQAQAQNVLISNLGQTDGNVGSLVSFDQAQAFTTGDNVGGYALTSVEIQTTGTPTLNTLRVSIRADSSGSPGTTSLGTLKNPASVASDGIAAFTASGAGIDLEKETTYFVVVDVTTGTSGNIQNTSSDAEDAGAAANWSIGNASVFRNKRGGSWGSWAQSKKIRINGTVKAGAGATDADLTGLVLKNAADDSAVTLSPGFATATKSYTASVANDAAAVTVEPAQSDSNATVAYLNASDMALTDADLNKTGFQVALAEGANTIKVKVTAEDGNTTDTYTVVVTRAATSTDATLSALALKDGSTAITLSPGFSSTTTSYTASVANAVDEITIVPEVNESNATYEIQDSGGTALADADDMEDGFQVSLNVGANTIKVEVTAEDTSTMETYTVVATRAAASSLTATLETPDYVVGGNLQYRFDLKLTEAVAIPNRDVRDHAFSVTNGRMVKAKRIHEGPGGSNHWRMTVEPYDETKPVTVTLRGNRACSEQGALCTGGGDHVINSPTLTLSAETLTLDSSNLPSVSIGNATAKENDAFLSFTVKLSRKVARTVAVDFKTVSGGTATEGADYRAQDYRVLFTPGETSIEAGVALIADTVDDVGETVKAEIANARVITARGAELGPLTIATAQATGTIDAPATSTTDVSNLTIRIDDTTGDEDDGWLDFSVSLSRTYTEYVCFDFETLTTGTATEGTDYGKRPKVNDWIRPGATQTTAFVRIIDDSVSDSGETVKVKIGNARLCGDASKTVSHRECRGDGNHHQLRPYSAGMARALRTHGGRPGDRCGRRSSRGGAPAGRRGDAGRAEHRRCAGGRRDAAIDGGGDGGARPPGGGDELAAGWHGRQPRGPVRFQSGIGARPAGRDRVFHDRQGGRRRLGRPVGPRRDRELRRARKPSLGGRRGCQRHAGRRLVGRRADRGADAVPCARLGQLSGQERWQGRVDADRDLSLRALCGERAGHGLGRRRLRRRQSCAEAGGRGGDRDRHGLDDGRRRAARCGGEGAGERRPRTCGQVGRHGGAHDLGRGAGA